MVAFNYSTMQMTAKIVYYGPGLGGKTTNLQYIYSHTASNSRGEMVLLETESDRTLFFDLLPLEVGSVGGFRTRIQLYTVPGQVFYNTTRKLVLKGVDAVVFVADSQRPMLQANEDSLRNLQENLAELNLALDSIPIALQYNKRDLPDICSIEELNERLNPRGWPHFEAAALTGQGVFETLKAISKLTLLSLRNRLNQGTAPQGRTLTAPVSLRRPAEQNAAPQPVTALLGPLDEGAGAERPVAAPAPPAEAGPRRRSRQLPATAVATTTSRVAAALAAEASPVAHRRAAGLATPGSPPDGDGATPPAVRPPPRPSAVRSRGGGDALAELERIKRQALGLRPAAPSQGAPPTPVSEPVPPEPVPSEPASPPAAAVAPGREISRDIRLTMSREELEPTRRFWLSLRAEGDDGELIEVIRDLQMDLDAEPPLDPVLLRLNIALRTED